MLPNTIKFRIMFCSNDPRTEWAVGVLVGMRGTTNKYHEILVGTYVDHDEESSTTTVTGVGLNFQGEKVNLNLHAKDEELFLYTLGQIYFCDNVDTGRVVYTKTELDAGLSIFQDKHLVRPMEFQ